MILHELNVLPGWVIAIFRPPFFGRRRRNKNEAAGPFKVIKLQMIGAVLS